MCSQRLHDSHTRALFVVAHPDDEIIGAGGSLLSRFKHCQIVHVTDGAPANMLDAQREGFNLRTDYANARRAEAAAALSLAGISQSQIIELGVTDQQAAYQLVSIVRRLTRLLRGAKFHVVVTQPYEGGHPDHDATAFAVHCACRLLLDENATAPEIFEMTSYHERDERVIYSQFLPHEGRTEVTFVLAEHEKELKRKMFDCFKTQRGVLHWFPIEVERFRQAPDYDFTQRPHKGTLNYERFDWGVTGEKWIRLAQEALMVLAQSEMKSSGSACS